MRGEGTSLTCFGSLYSGDNEESYMYRANAIWSNLDPLATDAELETW